MSIRRNEVASREPGFLSYSHNDMDGKAASYFIHKLADKLNIPNNPYNFINMGYDAPFNKHSKDDIVFITDLSFTEKTMQKLIEVCQTAKFVFWLDHHASSTILQRSIPGAKLKAIKNLICWTDAEFCGAMLAYVFYHLVDTREHLKELMDAHEVIIDMHRLGDGLSVYEASTYISRTLEDLMGAHLYWKESIDRNSAIRLIDDHDRWTKENEEMTTAFNLGINAENTSFTIYNDTVGRRVFNPLYGRIFNSASAKEYIDNGFIIRQYLDSRYKGERNMACGEYYLPGYGTYMVLNNRGNSWCFGEDYEHYQGSILYSFNEKTQLYFYSVYTPDVHIKNMPSNVLADICGGGGHPGAAGWHCTWPMFRCNQGGLGINNPDLNDVKFRVFYGSDLSTDFYSMVVKAYNDMKEHSADKTITFWPDIVMVDICMAHVALGDKNLIDVVLVNKENFMERMKTFHNNQGGTTNPFPILYDGKEFASGDAGKYDMAEFIADCLYDIVNNFIVE